MKIRSLLRSLAACPIAVSLPVVVTPIIQQPSAAYAQWTQWGGPKGDFKVDAKGLASTWPEEGPKKLWSRELGEGYSAILADGGRLYTMYRAEGKETVIALDAKTGKTLWEQPYESAPHETHVMQFGDGPRSTPLIVGDRLYTIGIAGKMHCLAKEDGKVYWSKDLWSDLGGTALNHGYSSSPILYKDFIIVLVGGEGHSIVALDRLSGSVVWQKHDFENSYSTPKVITLEGHDHLITFMGSEIVGLDPTTGDLQWSYEIGNQWKQNVCPPVWGPDNHLLFATPEAGARGVKLARNGDKVQVKELWSTRKIQFYHTNAIGIGDYVYGSTGGSTGGPAFFAAINTRTGEIAWRERGFAKATSLLADDKMLILDEDGQLALATVSPEKLTVHAKANILEKVAWTAPTLVGKTLYVRDKKMIHALDLG